MYGWLNYEWVEDGWAAHIVTEVQIFRENYFTLDQNLPDYILSWIQT